MSRGGTNTRRHFSRDEPEKLTQLPQLTEGLHPPPAEGRDKEFLSRVLGLFDGVEVEHIPATPIWTPEGTPPCRCCGGRRWWRLKAEWVRWICGDCHPPFSAPALVEYREGVEVG